MAAVARVDLRSAYAHELVVEALDACGWRCELADAVPGDGPLSMSWADFAAQDWDGVLEGRVVGSAHYLKSGLVRKASLHFYLARHATRERQRAMNAAAGVESAAAGASTGGAGDAGDEGPMPLSVVGDFETRDDDELDEFISAWRAVAATSGVSLWVLKPSEGNRSEGLAIVSIDDADAVRRLVRARDEFATWMLQRHVQPMLAAPCGGKSHDRKFHARAHVIAVGSISVWVHRAPLVLLAAASRTAAAATASVATGAPPYTPSPIIGVLTVPFSSATSCISVGDVGDAAKNARRAPPTLRRRPDAPRRASTRLASDRRRLGRRRLGRWCLGRWCLGLRKRHV